MFFDLRKILILMALFSLNIQVLLASPTFNDETLKTIKPMLNSERIKYFFGSYGIGPLVNTINSLRASNLYSLQDGKKVMRTFALVYFSELITKGEIADQELKLTHKKILAGGSIGAVLKKDGYNIIKRSLYFGEIELPNSLIHLMDEQNNAMAAIHIYRLSVTKDDLNNEIDYCTIIEVHSPQFLDLFWLQKIYQEDFADHTQITNEVRFYIENFQQIIARSV